MLSIENQEFIKESLPFFNNLTESEKSLLLTNSTYIKYTKETIMHSGINDCSGLYLVKKGQLRAFISSKNRELTVFRLLEYDICIFSASCILKNINFEIFVEASVDSEVINIPSSLFERLMKENMKVLEYTNELMASRFTELMWVVEQAIFFSFDKRLASFLLDQINIEGSLSLSITHEEIANHLASAREVVTRMLKYFQNDNILTLSRGKIEINDEEKLRKIIE